MGGRLRLAFLPIAAVPAVCCVFMACVGDSSVVQDAGGGDATTGNDAPSTNDVTQPTDSASSDGGGPSDAGVDAPPVTTTCTDPVNTSAYWQHCVAGEVSLTPGGSVNNGNYVLSRAWQQIYCPAGYVIGWGNVYVDNGHQFFRYYVERAATLNDPNPVIVKGTYWLQYDAGALSVEEMCDPNNKGNVRSGTINVSPDGGTFTMTWGDAGQEGWDIR